MHKTKKLTKPMLIENLIDYLPNGQREYKATQAYLDLCDALWSVVIAPLDDRPELQQSLKHQRSIWEDFCEFENERKAQAFENERQEHETMQAKYEASRPKEPKMSDSGWHTF